MNFTSLLFEVLISAFYFGLTSALAAVVLAPLQYLKVIRQETYLSYSSIVLTSFKKGGFSIFFRGALPYAIMNFISSASFGVSEFISKKILVYSSGLLISVVIRSLLGGFIETVSTIHSEMKEISKNKGELMKSKAVASSIFTSILIRNCIFWAPSAISYEVSVNYPDSYSSCIPLILGLISGLVSIPFDVVATKSCGGLNNNHNFLDKLKIIFANNKKEVFAGTLIRIVQMALFTLVTTIVMKILG